MSSITKTIIILVVIIAVGAGAYFFVFPKIGNPISLLQKESFAPDTSRLRAEGDFFSTLLNIKSIDLMVGSTLFSSQAFRSLKDFSLEPILSSTPGRVNPFAPLGMDAQSSPVEIIPEITPDFLIEGKASSTGATSTNATSTGATSTDSLR